MKEFKGVFYALLATLFFTTMSSMVKVLGQDYSSFQTMLFRNAVAMVILVPFILKVGIRETFASSRYDLHMARGLLGFATMIMWFYAYSNGVLVDIITIGYSGILFTTIFAVIFLHERIGRQRVIAILVGFLGVFFMVKPEGNMADPSALVALAASINMGIVTVFLKKLTRIDRAFTLLCVFTLLSTVLSIPLAAFVWQPMPLDDVMLGIAVGITGLLGQIFIIMAYKHAKAIHVAPMGYVSLIYGGIIGFFFFNELPDEWSLLGALIIIGATAYINWREYQLGKAAKIKESP